MKTGYAILVGIIVFMSIIHLFAVSYEDILNTFYYSFSLTTALVNHHLLYTIGASYLYIVGLQFLYLHASNISTSLKAPVIHILDLLEKAEETNYMIILVPLFFLLVAYFMVRYRYMIGARTTSEFMTPEMITKGYLHGHFLAFASVSIFFRQIFMFFCLYFIAIPTLYFMGFFIFLLCLTVPFFIYATVMYTHYIFIRHPLAPYVKSGKPIPASVMGKVSNMGGDISSNSRTPAFITENHRIKTEKVLLEIRQKKEVIKKQEQAEYDRKAQEEQRKMDVEYAKRHHEEMERVRRKQASEKKKFGTKEQQERRTALNKAQADLLDEFSEIQSADKNQHDKR